MSFILRLTSTSAAGREIVRTRRIDADTLTIGRDPASDIHLTDLEVTRHHAVIRRAGPQQLVVQALAGLPILVDGRSTKRAEIDAARGGEVQIGAVRIALSLGEEAGTIAASVSRAEPPVSEAEADKRFSLVGSAPGKRAMAWVAAVLVLGLFLAWPIWSYSQAPQKLTPEQMAGGYTHIDSTWSAGPLSLAHANLQHDCKACHVGAFVAVKDSACKTCHADVHDHADPKRLADAMPHPGGVAGLKLSVAGMFGRGQGRCVDCHLEHLGASPKPQMSGASCTDCHSTLKANLPDTKLADAGDFAKDHPQFMPVIPVTAGANPVLRRVSIDANPKQDTGLKFTHAMHMSRTNGVARMQQSLGHAPMQCASCHNPDDSGARFKPVSMEKNCQECHSLAFDRVGGTVRTLRHGEPEQVIADIRDFYAAHPGGASYSATDRVRPGAAGRPGYLGATGGGGGANAAIRGVFSKGGACFDCHVVTPPANGGLGYGIVPVRQPLRYMQHGWFDHSAHATEKCSTCHAKATTSNDWHAPMLPGIKTCRTCHGGEKASAPLIRSNCAMCHDYHRGDGALYDVRNGKQKTGGAAAGSKVALKLDWTGSGNADRADFGPAPWLRSRRPG